MLIKLIISDPEMSVWFATEQQAMLVTIVQLADQNSGGENKTNGYSFG